VRLDQIEPDRAGREALDHFRHRAPLPRDLLIFSPAGGEQRVVHPEPGELLPGRGRLGQFVLVVREAQVQAAAVDVELVPQILPGHRRALQVPARPAAAPRGSPSWPSPARLLVSLPQREVAGIPLAAGDPRPGGLHVGDLLPGQAAVRGQDRTSKYTSPDSSVAG
jgi:hypothetical protein